MTTEERRRRLRSHLALGGAALIAAAALVVWYVDRITPSNKHMDPASYFGVKENEAAVSVDGALSETHGNLIGGEPYLDYATVSKQINPSVFFDHNEEKLIVTTPTEKTVLPLADGSTSGGEAQLSDGELYVAESYLAEVTDAKFSVFEEPVRVVVSTAYEYPVMTLLSDAPVRYRAGIKSPILADLPEGSEIRVTDVSADGEPAEDKISGWTHVLTEDGYAGYVEDKYLTDPHTRRIDHVSPIGEYTSMRSGETMHVVFHQTTDQASNNALTESLAGVSGPNVIAPTWLFLNSEDGEVTSLVSKSYVETAHAAGLKVWAVLNDFDGGIASAASTAAALSTDTSRSAIVSSVMRELTACGADGLNLDIELVSADAAGDYLELIREFSVECRNAGLVLSIDNYVPTFTNYLGRSEQARVADYLIVMCYDEHTAGSAEAGSVSSLPFVRRGIEDTIAQAGEEKTIAAIPFFTRMWEIAEDGAVSSRSYGMSGAAARMKELGMTVAWDEETAQNYAETKSGGSTWRIWVEDAASIERKMEVITEHGCAGVAEWKLGLETSDIWGCINKYLS